jgi:aminopeptidase N
MFDQVSYQKGGRILHMLRNYVGDKAFFASLNKYLTTNKFGNGSAHKLRLAFEEVSGKDLNWFFNQWYFGSGHPKLEISYGYDSAAHIANVYIKQTQSGDKIFRLPLAIDIYDGAQKTRHQVWADSKSDTFSFAAARRPDLINVDGDKIILADKRDNKTLAEFIHQYTYAGKYLDRREALDFASKKMSDQSAYQLHLKALNDPYDRIRAKAIQGLNLAKLDAAAYSKIETIAKNDPKRLVRADAIDLLSKSNNIAYKDLYLAASKDSSYTVAGAGLLALSTVDSVLAYQIAKDLSTQPTKGRLTAAISNVIIQFGDESAYDYIISNFTSMPLSQEKFGSVTSVADFLAKLTNQQKFEKGVDELVKFRDEIPSQIKVQTDPYINNMILKGLATKKEKAGAKAMADYVNSKIPVKK